MPYGSAQSPPRNLFRILRLNHPIVYHNFISRPAGPKFFFVYLCVCVCVWVGAWGMGVS